MSFLDVISCGFGAVILLFVIALALEPRTVGKIFEDLRELISQTNKSRETLTNESQKMARELSAKKKRLVAIKQHLEDLNQKWKEAQGKHVAARSAAEAQARIEEQLKTVRQTLSEEMKRLLSQPSYKPPSKDATIGGIPVDSEYIIFVIDTSGSMKKGAWPLVVKKVEEVLSVYPKVKGIQVISDMGRYMFATYEGRWIPDTPARRAAVIERIRNWNSFSNSSPVEGVVYAIQRFFREDRRISLYVFGDDFTGESINDVIEQVAHMNKKDAAGKPRVRIHAFGFPVLFQLSNANKNISRFAHLMRVLAERNGGSFVGLNSLQ